MSEGRSRKKGWNYLENLTKHLESWPPRRESPRLWQTEANRPHRSMMTTRRCV